MKNPLLSLSLAFTINMIALYGGMQFYLDTQVLEVWTGLGWLFIFWGLWVIVTRLWVTDLWLYLLLPVLAVVISIVYNYEVAATSFGRLWLYLVAIGVLLFANSDFTPRQILDGLWWAGLIWPVVWAVASLSGWWDHPNVLAFWSLLFIVVTIHHRSWLYALPHLIMLIYLSSRGAIVGIAVSVGVTIYLAWDRPKLKPGYIAACSVGAIVALWALVMWQPVTAMVRLDYWHDAWLAFLHNPAVGVGPGGLKARELIPEIYSPLYQIHAHNALISWLAQTGLMGSIYLGIAAWRVYVNRAAYQFESWQLALFAGVLAWSMVDEPLFWPGPLVIMALVVGSIQPKGRDRNENHSTI